MTTRRAFLIVAGGAVAGGVAVAAGLLTLRDDEAAADVPDGAADRLRAFFSDPAGARRLGEAHLDAHPASAAALASALTPAGEDASAWFAITDDEAFARHLRQRVVRDFETGSETVVHEWRLATSEADACALWALT